MPRPMKTWLMTTRHVGVDILGNGGGFNDTTSNKADLSLCRIGEAEDTSRDEEGRAEDITEGSQRDCADSIEVDGPKRV